MTFTRHRYEISNFGHNSNPASFVSNKIRIYFTLFCCSVER